MRSWRVVFLENTSCALRCHALHSVETHSGESMVAAVSRVPAPLKWHGGKWYLAPKIVELMPSHVHYVEPFAGGLSVLLAKDPDGISEVVNDIDGQLSNFWRVLQGEEAFERFR